jgi:hypothetical protein
MNQQFKPYSKIAYLDSLGASAITLTDTTGNKLPVNFISVTASAGAGGGNWFSVAASSISTSGAVDGTIFPAMGMWGEVSGVPGGVASVEKGVVELLLPDTDRVDTIYISQFVAQPLFLMINYGQVYSGNALRDFQRPKGN